MKRRELIDSLMGLKISSTFLIWVLLCKYLGALKKGIFFFHLFTLEVEPQRTAMARVVGDLGLFGCKENV